MASLPVELHPAAQAEATEARDWYLAKSPRAARAFLAELDRAIAQIEESPTRWPKYLNDTRRYVFPRYPFGLVYRFREGHVEVLAVAHHKRRPGYWADRK